jgi:hypothetical protein
MPIDYVKASTTTVAVEKSQGEIIAALHRYGAHGFGFRKIVGSERTEVTFHICDESGRERTVTIPIEIDRVHTKAQALNERRVARGAHVKKAVSREQAERIAWRVLLDWVEATLLVVSLGAQTIEEAFFAHTVVTTDDGKTGRMIDYVHSIESFGDGDGRMPRIGTEWRQLGAGG